jgi:ATP-dependent Clp protease ATP-binding subunit ClpC
MLRNLPYTQRARNIVIAAQKEAKKLQALEVKSIHILLAGAAQKGSVIQRALEMMELSYELLFQELKLLNQAKAHDSTEPSTSAEAKALYDLAAEIANSMSNPFVGTEHLLLALSTQSDSDAAKILSKKGFPRERVCEIVYGILEMKLN